MEERKKMTIKDLREIVNSKELMEEDLVQFTTSEIEDSDTDPYNTIVSVKRIKEPHKLMIYPTLESEEGSSEVRVVFEID